MNQDDQSIDDILIHLQTVTLYADNTEPGSTVARNGAEKSIQDHYDKRIKRAELRGRIDELNNFIEEAGIKCSQMSSRIIKLQQQIKGDA